MTCGERYDQYLVIETLSGTADAMGHIDNTVDTNWDTYCTAYANVRSKGGREFWKVSQVSADVTHVWKCPWGYQLEQVTPDMRLKHRGIVYEILSVENIDFANNFVEIRTKRAV